MEGGRGAGEEIAHICHNYRVFFNHIYFFSSQRKDEFDPEGALCFPNHTCSLSFSFHF